MFTIILHVQSERTSCNEDSLYVIRYLESSRYKKMRYEDDFLRYLQNIMADVDRRIRRGHARLNLSRDQEEKVCNHHYVLCTVHAIIF